MDQPTPASITRQIQEVRSRLSALPRQRFAHLPTPLDHLPRAAEHLQGPRMWIKRDDCTGLAFGGNKARQLEYILGDAVAQGADVVIQGAASQSNHSRQLAAAAARVGLDSVILPRQDHFYARGGGNQLVTRLLAGELHPVEIGQSVSDAKSALEEKLRAEGRRPYVVGMGAYRALALAAVAYVEAFVEIIETWLANDMGELPTHIYTTSQGSTQAGLQLGAHLLQLPMKVVGINPMDETNEAYNSTEAIRSLIDDAARFLDHGSIDVGPINNVTDYVGPAYGIPSPASEQAISFLAKQEGILLDPVYSGKGFAGLIDHIREGQIGTSDRVVFIHTGGLPALFADFDLDPRSRQ